MTQLSIKQGLEMTTVKDNTSSLQKQNTKLSSVIDVHKNQNDYMT